MNSSIDVDVYIEHARLDDLLPSGHGRGLPGRRASQADEQRRQQDPQIGRVRLPLVHWVQGHQARRLRGMLVAIDNDSPQSQVLGDHVDQ